MKKLNMFIILILALALLPLVSSYYGLISAGGSGEFVGYAKQGGCFTLKQTCADCTYVNISAVIDSSGNITTTNTAMNKIGGFYNYPQCGNLINGRVDVTGIFNPDGINQTFNYYYEVNPTGNPTTDNSSNIGIIIAIISVMLFFGFIGIKLLDSVYPQIGYFFLAISGVLSIISLFDAYLFTKSLVDTSLSGVHFGIFTAIFIAIGFIFILMVVFVLYNLFKNLIEKKEKKKYGEGYNTSSKQYEY